jgi:hypothetical protein
MNEWNIQARAHACQSCAQPFTHRQPYHTLLYDEKAEYLHRMDICDACWQSQFSEGARERKGFLSHWQGIFEVPPPAAPDAIQKETAETLLRKLIEQNDPRYAPAAFILAVMLERKRLLKVKEQIKRDNRRLFLYEHPKSGDIFTIVDPELHLNQLEAVQRDVAQLLEHGAPPDPPPEYKPGTAIGETTTDSPGEAKSTEMPVPVPVPNAPADVSAGDQR